MYKKLQIEPPYPLETIYRLSSEEMEICKSLGLDNVLVEAAPEVYIFVSGKSRNVQISADHRSQNSRMLLEHARFFASRIRELSK